MKKHIVITGRVQGVGFRFWLYKGGGQCDLGQKDFNGPCEVLPDGTIKKYAGVVAAVEAALGGASALDDSFGSFYVH